MHIAWMMINIRYNLIKLADKSIETGKKYIIYIY